MEGEPVLKKASITQRQFGQLEGKSPLSSDSREERTSRNAFCNDEAYTLQSSTIQSSTLHLDHACCLHVAAYRKQEFFTEHEFLTGAKFTL